MNNRAFSSHAVKFIVVFPSLFASEFSSFQGTGTTEYRMTSSFEVQQHFLRRSIRKSTWYAIVSSVPLFSDPGPRKDQ